MRVPNDAPIAIFGGVSGEAVVVKVVDKCNSRDDDKRNFDDEVRTSIVRATSVGQLVIAIVEDDDFEDDMDVSLPVLIRNNFRTHEGN